MASLKAEESANSYSDSFKLLLDQLPKTNIGDYPTYYNYDGFWYAGGHLEATKFIQSNFVARDDDVILASSLKTGSTWLKALVYCIMGPKITDLEDDPLSKKHPAVCVETLEVQTFLANPSPDLSGMPSRIFHTHIPYGMLPDSIKSSGCKIVYIVRNPKDTIVSLWHFFNFIKPCPFELMFEGFCNGVHPFGPFFDHVLQYWNESLKAPQKILFLKYEDLKKDPKGQVKKLASFLGRPLDDDEEINKVIWRSSLDRLKNLDVNKSGMVHTVYMPNSSYFRLGVVGDWKNTLTPEMEERLDQITKMRLAGSGLELNV